MWTDAFIDFSRVAEHLDVRAAIAQLDTPDRLGAVAPRVTCAVGSGAAVVDLRPRRGWTVRALRAVDACRTAMAAAAADQRPLLVLFGDVQPSCAAVGLLLEALESDPMIGFASARVTGVDGHSLACLDRAGDLAIDELPRRLLAELPDTYLVADVPSRCLLIRPLVLGDFAELDDRFETLEGALWHYMSRARRCGFRTLICNRAVVTARSFAHPSPPSSVAVRSLPAADRVLLRELSPDIEQTIREFGTATPAAAETRLARALPDAYGTHPSLLLDVRNIVAGMNGTTIAALGIAGGLHALQARWDVTLLAPRDAAAFHDLEPAFPGWRIETKVPDRQFTAALRLSQPWHMQEMVDLHSAAAFNFYLFLDTISWDVSYPAPRHLQGTWQFMAEQADGLLFLSAFTRDRFLRRFRVPRDMPDVVAHLSFDPADHVQRNVRVAAERERFIFIVGNEYDHKDVGPTMELLATAFPYEPIVALGAGKAATPRVTVLQGGTLSDAEIHRLYASARLVVFPSFYEGFGIPVITALAYGGTVVARESALLHEIAARCVPRGRIVPFVRRDDLVDVIGRLLHGGDVPTVPLGTALDDGRPRSWEDAAAGIVAFIERVAANVTRSRWRSREHTIAQLMAAPAALTDKRLARADGVVAMSP